MPAGRKKQIDMTYVERLHARAKDKEAIYIACEDLNFAWIKAEIATVKMAWNAGKPIWEIASLVRRPEEEVAILIIDLNGKRELGPRPGGVFGCVKSI